MTKQRTLFGVNAILAVVAAAMSGSAQDVQAGGGYQCGSQVFSNIAVNGQVHSDTITLLAGQNVIIDVDAYSIGSTLDALVGFFDTDGTTLLGSSNDYFPPGQPSTNDPFLIAVAPADGIYYIKVSSYDDNDFDGGADAYTNGTYELSVTCVDADPGRQPNDDYQTATPVGCNTTLTNYFLGDKDVDYYAVVLQAGATIAVDLDSHGGTLDGQAVLYDTDGVTQLSPISDDDPAPGEGASLDPYFSYTVPSTGTYYIAIGSYDDDDFNGGPDSGSSGFYDLIIEATPCALSRVSTVKKGSLLIFPKVELRWDLTGKLTQETILTLVNDFSKDVHVKLYFVNGDAPTEAIYADPLQTILVERAHNGWNQVDCGIELTENESTYLVMSNGVGGCQRFTVLDPGTPPGRPNFEADGGRVLRGFVVAFATDENQNEISYNHLSGHADLIHYGLRSAWEYQAYAFQAINPSTGTATDAYPGQINLDGVEYDFAFNTLLFDFFAVGSSALSNGGVTVMLDTDLTLHPVSVDLRQDTCGPITTKAHFDIWNANEDFRSGTARCITCWDQTLLSAYSVGNGWDNNFILADLGTDKGKARIDGMESFECDNLFVPPDLDDAILQWLLLHDRGCVTEGKGKHMDCCQYTINDSQDAALLGVAAKILSFSGGATGTTWAGMNLVGAGQEVAQILFDVPAPPETASNGNDDRDGRVSSERNSLRNNSKSGK